MFPGALAFRQPAHPAPGFDFPEFIFDCSETPCRFGTPPGFSAPSSCCSAGFIPDKPMTRGTPRTLIASERCERQTSRLAERASTRCRDGYRSAKRQGKPNFTNGHFPLCRRHFFDFAFSRAMRAFTSRSSRTLNCPSNLIGHDHPNNRPENGVGITGRFDSAQGPRSGEGGNDKKGRQGCFRDISIWTRRRRWK